LEDPVEPKRNLLKVIVLWLHHGPQNLSSFQSLAGEEVAARYEAEKEDNWPPRRIYVSGERSRRCAKKSRFACRLKPAAYRSRLRVRHAIERSRRLHLPKIQAAEHLSALALSIHQTRIANRHSLRVDADEKTAGIDHVNITVVVERRGPVVAAKGHGQAAAPGVRRKEDMMALNVAKEVAANAQQRSGSELLAPAAYAGKTN
jgi:hypothetical protein